MQLAVAQPDRVNKLGVITRSNAAGQRHSKLSL
jgi:hypothetical protein